MARRPLTVALALLALTAVGCRRDTIRTTSGVVTTVADGSTTTAAKGKAKSTTTVKGGSASTAKGATTGGPGTDGDAASSVVLSGSSLGPTKLGAPADEAVAAMRTALGPPTRDMKDPGAQCPGPDRLVRWGRLSLYFSGGSLAGWGYEAEPAGPPQLATPSGITVGSTVATIRRVYGDKVTFAPGDDPYPATFRVPIGSSALTGTLTGTTDASTTTGLYFGVGCGE
jgi:hypothetical protein